MYVASDAYTVLTAHQRVGTITVTDDADGRCYERHVVEAGTKYVQRCDYPNPATHKRAMACFHSYWTEAV